MREFVSYYFSEGVDRIYVVDDFSSLPLPEVVLSHPRVEVVQMRMNPRDEMQGARFLFESIRHRSEWFLLIDADEFIVTKRHPERSLRDEFQMTFRDADIVKIPWVMMSCNGYIKDPPSLLGCIVHRWNHDLRHNHPTGWYKGRCRYDAIEVKCAFRANKISDLGKSSHFPRVSGAGARVVESIDNGVAELNAFYGGLREVDISRGFLLCYHFRMVSAESCERKVRESAFADYRTDLENLLACDYPEVLDFTVASRFSGKVAR